MQVEAIISNNCVLYLKLPSLATQIKFMIDDKKVFLYLVFPIKFTNLNATAYDSSCEFWKRLVEVTV